MKATEVLSYTSERSKGNHVPYDILITIFEYFGRVDIQDISGETLYGRKTDWKDVILCRRSVVQVCKSWWYAGIPLLYRDIYLHRVGQLSALKRTLEDHSSQGTLGRRNLVHSLPQYTVQLIVDVYVVREWEDVYKEDFGRVLEICSSVRGIVYNPTPGYMVNKLGRQSMGVNVNLSNVVPNYMSILPNLTTLSLGSSHDHDDFWTHPPKMSFLRYLIHLEITLNSQRGYTFEIELPVLRRLTCVVMDYCVDLTHLSNWSLPSLTHLTLHHCGQLGASKFLNVFGKQLTFLSFGDVRHPFVAKGYPMGLSLEDILALAPNLEHVACADLGPISRQYPLLRRIDVLSPTLATWGLSESVAKGFLPTLDAMGYPHPRQFHSKDISVAREWQQIARSLGLPLVGPDSQPIVLPDIDEMDSSDSEGYSPYTSDSGGSSEFWGSDSGDEPDPVGVVSVDHDTALERFHDGLPEKTQDQTINPFEFISSDSGSPTSNQSAHTDSGCTCS